MECKRLISSRFYNSPGKGWFLSIGRGFFCVKQVITRSILKGAECLPHMKSVHEAL